MGTIRLRQVALVARDLDAVVGELCDVLGATVCFRDPGVAEFGLHNALMVVGDQFLEVVSPTQPDTTAGRLLDKRGGDGGYMAIYEVDDLDRRLELLAAHDVRVVWGIDLPTIRGRHLHPRDVGGTLVSIDEPQPPGSWTWAGPEWQHHGATEATAIARVRIGAEQPGAIHARWRALDLGHDVDFVASGERGDGLDGIDVVATDRRRAGASFDVAGVRLTFV